MRSPNTKVIVGVDEAGRGPLAGPVVAAAVAVLDTRVLRLAGNFDSKILTPNIREEVYRIITRHPQVEWGMGKVSEKVIDAINILQAGNLAMAKAVENLRKKLNRRETDVRLIFVDGIFRIPSPLPQKLVVGGDRTVPLCMMASIIAKVSRDRIMEKWHRKYPLYGFDKHKGYGTKYHLKMLKIFGPCEIHRKSFSPVIMNS